MAQKSEYVTEISVRYAAITLMCGVDAPPRAGGRNSFPRSRSVVAVAVLIAATFTKPLSRKRYYPGISQYIVHCTMLRAFASRRCQRMTLTGQAAPNRGKASHCGNTARQLTAVSPGAPVSQAGDAPTI